MHQNNIIFLKMYIKQYIYIYYNIYIYYIYTYIGEIYNLINKCNFVFIA
jgi:hypothetical protein